MIVRPSFTNEIKSNFRKQAATKPGEEADFLAAADYVEKFIIHGELSTMSANQFIHHLNKTHEILAQSLLANRPGANPPGCFRTNLIMVMRRTFDKLTDSNPMSIAAIADFLYKETK